MSKRNCKPCLKRIPYILFMAGLCGSTACQPWLVQSGLAQRDAGLVVLYPGTLNTRIEMSGFKSGLRAGGVEQAIEIAPWSDKLELMLAPEGIMERVDAWAAQEAARLAEYKARHPGAAVTLLGYSSGAAAAIMTAERMPSGALVDRVILMSPGVSRDYDLSAMLRNTSGKAYVYWSPLDQAAEYLVSRYGTIDGVYEKPAATYGFTCEDEKLIQMCWTPEMSLYGNNGQHWEYLNSPEWIRDYVAPLAAGIE